MKEKRDWNWPGLFGALAVLAWLNTIFYGAAGKVDKAVLCAVASIGWTVIYFATRRRKHGTSSQDSDDRDPNI